MNFPLCYRGGGECAVEEPESAEVRRRSRVTDRKVMVEVRHLFVFLEDWEVLADWHGKTISNSLPRRCRGHTAHDKGWRLE